MVATPFVRVMVNVGETLGTCDRMSALYGPMVMLAVAGLPLAVTTELPTFP